MPRREFTGQVAWMTSILLILRSCVLLKFNTIIRFNVFLVPRMKNVVFLKEST